MRKLVILISYGLLLFVGNLHAVVASDCLKMLLTSADIADRRVAYLEIIKNKEAYIDQVQGELYTYRQIKNPRSDVFTRLLYLAAVLKSEKLINPLERILEDTEYLKNYCLYDCPLSLAIAVYAVSLNSSFGTNGAADGDTISSSESLLRTTRKTSLVRGRPQIEWASQQNQELQRKAVSLSEVELIEQAGPDTWDATLRLIAADVLANTVIDDTNLTDLYWLALEELYPDGAQEYRTFIYLAILRAEKARASRIFKQR
jgi:hypothetical protein